MATRVSAAMMSPRCSTSGLLLSGCGLGVGFTRLAGTWVTSLIRVAAKVRVVVRDGHAHTVGSAWEESHGRTSQDGACLPPRLWEGSGRGSRMEGCKAAALACDANAVFPYSAAARSVVE
jgi:hypothetical protein